MTDLNHPHVPSADYEKFLSEAVEKHGARIQTLEQIAEIWRGGNYKSSQLLKGDAFEKTRMSDEILVLRALNHRGKTKEEISAFSLKAKLTADAAAATNQEDLLQHDDTLVMASGETGKVARFYDMMSELAGPEHRTRTVATDKHIVIRLRGEFEELFGKHGLTRLLSSKPYHNLFLDLSGGTKVRKLSSQQIAGIKVPIFARDKALLLNILLSVEPNAPLEKMFKLLDRRQGSKEAILCFCGEPAWREFSELPAQTPIAEVRECLWKLVRTHGEVFLNANRSSKDPFVEWMRQFVMVANHLEEILKCPPSAEQIVTLQGWRIALSDRNQAFRAAWEHFRVAVKGDFPEIKDQVLGRCNKLFEGIRTLSLRREQEVMDQVKRSVPLHPSSLEEAAKSQALARRLTALWEHSRGLTLPSSELYVIPLFLYLVKEPEFRDALVQQNRAAFDAALHRFSSKSETHHGAVRWFSTIQSQLQEREFWEILSHAQNCWSDLDPESFKRLTRDFLGRISQRNIKQFGETSLSKEMMRLMVQAARITPTSRIYIPYTPGFEFSDFLPEYAEGCFQFRSEHDAGIFALHELIMERNSEFQVSDPVTNWNPFGEEISSVIAAPPFNQKIRHHPEFRDADVHCIIESARLIKDDGRAIICVAPSFLFRSDRLSEYRRNLIQQNIIDTAIYLPPGLLESSGIRTILLILRPPSAEPKSVVLVDASECLQKLETSRRSILDLAMLQSLLEADEHPNKRSVPQAELETNGYDLSPGRYLLQKLEEIPENHSVYTLGELIKRSTRFPRCQAGDRGVQINQRFFPASDNLDPVSFDDRETTVYEELGSQAGWRLVNRDALILNSILMKDGLRACLFEHKGKNLFLRPDMLTFEVRSEIVDPQWLLLSLSSEFVKSQLQTLTLGAGIPRIRTELLLGLKLAVPNQRDQQRTLVAYHKEALLKSRSKELGLEEHIQSIKKAFLDDLRLKKHSISQITNDIKSAIAVILDELDKKGSISADQIISQRRSINFRDYLQGMSQKCGALGGLINKLTEENKHEPLAPLDLKQAMRQLLKEYQGEDFKMTFGIDERSFVDQTNGRPVKPLIRIGANDFQSLCRNIIDNAKRHAFKGNFKGASILVDAELFHEEQMIELCFMNNGAPFPKGMDLDRFVLRGEKAGSKGNSGTGGYHIKSIMDHVGGRLDICTPPFDEYSTEVRLFFPYYHEDSL